MIGIGIPELVVIFLVLLVILGVFFFGYFVGKGRGFRKGLDYTKKE